MNVNYVFGIGDNPQAWMPPGVWLALLMVAFPVLIYVPTHLVLKAVAARRARLAVAPLP